jgi:hypothetical protein
LKGGDGGCRTYDLPFGGVALPGGNGATGHEEPAGRTGMGTPSRSGTDWMLRCVGGGEDFEPAPFTGTLGLSLPIPFLFLLIDQILLY